MKNHGTVKLDWCNDLLIIHFYGPFNLEGAADVINTMKAAVIDKGLSPWQRMEVWDPESIGSPEVMELGKSFYAWCEEQGCNKAAIVISDQVQKRIIDEQFPGRFNLFDSLDDANVWLANS